MLATLAASVFMAAILHVLTDRISCLIVMYCKPKPVSARVQNTVEEERRTTPKEKLQRFVATLDSLPLTEDEREIVIEEKRKQIVSEAIME